MGLERAGVLHHLYHYDAARMLAGDNFAQSGPIFATCWGEPAPDYGYFASREKPATSVDHY